MKLIPGLFENDNINGDAGERRGGAGDGRALE